MRHPRVFSVVLLGLLWLQGLTPLLLAHAEGEEDPLWNRPSFEKKVTTIGQRILAANGIKERIQFVYSTKDIRNASAQRWNSGNLITIYKDMLDVISSDDELAAVISHEIVHIVHRHTRKSLYYKIPIATGVYAVAGLATYATYGLAAPTIPLAAKMSAKATIAPLDRNKEKEADLIGLDYMVHAGYNPLAMETLMDKVTADAGIFTTFFSSHPLGKERLGYIHEAIQNHYPQFISTDLVDSINPGSPYQFQPAEQEHEKHRAPQLLVTSEKKHATVIADSAHEQKAVEERVSQIAHRNDSNQDSSPIIALATDIKPASEPTQAPLTKAITTTDESVITPNALPQPTEKTEINPEIKKSAQRGKQFLQTSSPIEVSQTHSAPQKRNYKAHQATLPSKPQSHQYTTQVVPSQKMMLASAASQSEQHPSIAMVLLSLKTEEQRALQLIVKHHYLSRQDLTEFYPGLEENMLNMTTNALIEKRLIRIVGADSERGYMLTDWASQALESGAQ